MEEKTMETVKNMRYRTYDKVKIGLFALTMALLFFVCILHTPKEFSEEENRFLAKMPNMNPRTLLDGSFMTDYETYIVDQFPERSFFTGIKTLSERLIGKTDDNGVFFGKDGYLFGKHDTALFESELAEKNKNFLAEFAKNYGKKFGKGHFQIALVPSSGEVLREKLPKFAPQGEEEKLIEGVMKKAPKGMITNLGQVMKMHGDEYIYYRTDHHWTGLGAFYAYEALAEHFGYRAKPLQSFLKEEVSEPFLGTYDSKVSTKVSGGVIPDVMTLYYTENASSVTMTWDGKEERIHRGIFLRESLKKKDKYAVYMGGNHGITDLRTMRGKGTLLVVKDSFAHSLVPFLLEDYERIVMIDLRHFNKSLKKFIDENEVTDLLVLYSTADLVTDNNIAKLLR